jgi:CheY-like chemotaxis protein
VSTVLVVQSDPALIASWCSALEAAGHEVLASKAFTEGIKRVREGGIDIIVVDSEGNGGFTDFVDELLDVPDPPPFVMVSSSPKAPEESAHFGAAAFLPKPCPPAEIEDTVHRLTLGTGSDPKLPRLMALGSAPDLAPPPVAPSPAPSTTIDDEPTRPRAKTPTRD